LGPVHLVDHAQDCSGNMMRFAGSSQADPILATAAAALSGPIHGGDNDYFGSPRPNASPVTNSAASSPAGIRIVKVLPFPTSLWTVIVPR